MGITTAFDNQPPLCTCQVSAANQLPGRGILKRHFGKTGKACKTCKASKFAFV
jgi:hypothetical protein